MIWILIICVISLLAYVGLLLYCRKAWIQMPDFQGGVTNEIKISVIIPARNEAANLYDLLTSLQQQTYPAELLEIIVVDDYSTDATASIVQNFPAKNIQLISLEAVLGPQKINAYKKKAIETGIAHATGNLILCTDADCIMDSDWVATMVSFQQQKDAVFVAAPVRMASPRKSIEIFQALDFMSLQGITGAAVYKNIMSMCNGANLLYRKDTFRDVDGFTGIDDIASGDDMLLMHKFSQAYPDRVKYLKSQDAIVDTEPVHTVKEFFRQRIRWASKSGKYADNNVSLVLLLVYLLNVLLFLIPIALIILSFYIPVLYFWWAWLGLLLFKTVAELFFLYPVARFFEQEKLLWYFPLAQPFHVCYTVIAGALGLFGSYEWKGRRVK
ncbi:MAG: glycosyltransferase [Ferruginibacter sp.]